MVKVVALTTGYFGGVVRYSGDSFSIPDDLWKNEHKRPSWVKLDPSHAFGGKGDHDGDGSVGGSKPAASDAKLVVVPADWPSLSAAKRKALAKQISGGDVPNATEADKIIAIYVGTNKPAPFDDAPEPVRVVNEINDATGGTQPDWVAPSSAPMPVAD